MRATQCLANRRGAGSLFFAAAVMIAAPAFAHHGGGTFELNKTVSFSGAKLTKLEFLNPHGWLYFETTENGKVQKLHCIQVDEKFKPIEGTEFELEAQLVLLAMGFVHPVHEGMLKSLGVDLDQRGNVRANMQDYQTSLPNVFSAGDMRRGQSLVVWAIREGRLCARAIDQYLMGTTTLPR